MRSFKILLLALLLSYTSAFAQSNYGLTVFGTDKISASQIQEEHGRLLDELVELKKENPEIFEARKKLLEEELLQDANYSYINLALIKSYSNELDFILDIVEKQDSSKRLIFKKMETRRLLDSDSLIARWSAYAKLSRSLFEKGEINDFKCPVIHCTWSFNHPDLEPFAEYFSIYASKNKNQLEKLLLYSEDDAYRASAAFLLAHTDLEIQALVNLLESTVDDPSSLVRNNSMRVIYYAIRNNPSLELSLDKTIQVLNYPSFTDRNKALVVLRSLPKERFSQKHLTQILPILIEVLEKKDAHNYKNAYTILKNISGEQFDIDDIKQWKHWVDTSQL